MTNDAKPAPTVANVLPIDARDALVIASTTRNTRSDPLARQKAIEAATQRAKLLYPRFFKHLEI